VTVIDPALPATDPLGHTQPRSNLVGGARRLVELDHALPVHDLYDPVGSALYDEVGWGGYDTTSAIRLSTRFPGAVLDLACGSGRIGLALARRGRAVVGIDASPAMLDRFRAALDDEPGEVASAVNLVEGDICGLDLAAEQRAAGLAVLGATTIVLVEPDRRVELFRRVRAHLRPGGAFALDFYPLDVADLRSSPKRRSFIEFGSSTPLSWLLIWQDFDLSRRQERVSMLIERTGPRGRVGRTVVTTRKWIVERHAVEADLVAAGFDLDGSAAPGPSAYEWIVGVAR